MVCMWGHAFENLETFNWSNYFNHKQMLGCVGVWWGSFPYCILYYRFAITWIRADKVLLVMLRSLKIASLIKTYFKSIQMIIELLPSFALVPCVIVYKYTYHKDMLCIVLFFDSSALLSFSYPPKQKAEREVNVALSSKQCENIRFKRPRSYINKTLQNSLCKNS